MMEQSEDPPKRNSPRKERPGVEAAQAFIAANFHLPIMLDALAEAAEMPTNTLSRAYNEKLGMSPMRALWAYRCEQARIMIDNYPDLAIQAVAARCGFQSLQHFSRRMRVHLGMAPTRFRKLAIQRLEKSNP